MTDKIDMSLDDIIKKNKGGRGGGRGRGGRSRGGGRGGGGGRGARRTSGGVSGGRGRGGARGGRRMAGGGRGGRSRSPYVRGNAEGNWSHDMYDGPNRRGGVAVSSGPTKLVVSNLDFGVSNNDIQELFSEFGKLRSATIHYDRSGRSQGSADVIFDRKGDAIKAMKQYNNVPLDGRPMNILMATSDIAPASQRLGRVPRRPTNDSRRRSGGRIEKPRGRGGFKRGGRGGGGRGRGRGGKKDPTPSAEDLDKELD